MKYIRIKAVSIKTLLIVIVAVFSILVCYKSFDMLTSASAAAYNALDPDIERIADEYMGADFLENAKDGQTFEDSRDLKESVSNISNRGEIYKSLIPTLKEDPMRLLIGKYSSKIMDIPNKYQSYPYFHMHNYLLQVLMLAGIVGFLLVAAFTVLLVVKMIKLFFCSHPEASIAVKTLTLPLSGIFIYGMLETIIFTVSADQRAVTDFRELFFFLLAGIFLGYYYQFFPAKKK